MWKQLAANGFIAKGGHSGFYQTNEETFFQEKDLVKNEEGQLTVPVTGEVCDHVTQENYVFKVNPDIKA